MQIKGVVMPSLSLKLIENKCYRGVVNDVAVFRAVNESEKKKNVIRTNGTRGEAFIYKDCYENFFDV